MAIKEQGKKQNVIAPRMMPHSLDAEQSVLGSLLIDDTAGDKVFANLVADDFYTQSHKKIFEATQRLFLAREPIDFVTLTDELEKRGYMEDVGGMDYINSLTNAVPSTANISSYVRIVKRYSTLRQLIYASNDIIEKSYSGTDNETDVLRFAERHVFDIGKAQQKSDLEKMAVTLSDVISEFETLTKDPTSLRGLYTGFKTLDKVTNGLQKGALIIIAARPSVGKTALALNIVTNTALKKKARVAMFSLEMPKKQLGQRAICSVGSVNLKHALSGELSHADWQNIWSANKEIANAEIFVDDSSMITPWEIQSKCERFARERGGLDLVVIDYIQLISNPTLQKENRATQVADISRRLKIMARELDVPVIALSQLSRSVEAAGKHRRPVLSDLRESGAIEQDADIVMFLHREDEDETKKNDIQLIISKNRNGPLEDIDLKFHPEIVTFIDMAEHGFKREKVVPADAKPAKKSDAKIPSAMTSIADIETDQVFKNEKSKKAKA